MTPAKVPYKVIQWATGQIGQYVIERCANHPDFELVGCWVFSDAKVGIDAGEIANIAPIGVLASKDESALLGLEADIVIYAPLLANVDEMCRILAAGKNLITPSGFTTIRSSADRARLVRACMEGNSTLHGSGIHPGFAGDRLPLVLSAMCRQINKITVYEIVNMGEIGESPEMIFDQLGFNMPAAMAAKEPPALLEIMSTIFFESIELVARGLGIEIERFEKQHEFAVAKEDTAIAAGVIEEGHVAGQHFTYQGIVAGEPAIVFETYWKTGGRTAPDWPYDAHCRYDVIIDGDPSMKMQLDFERLDQGEPGMLGTAMNCVNSIPMVVAAAAGFKTQLDLPLITAVNAFKSQRV